MKKLSLCCLLFLLAQVCKPQSAQLKINWDEIITDSKSTPTLQVVGNPMLRPSGKMRMSALKALRDLGADYVRYVPWFPYPKLAVAELEPPTDKKTFWDFSLIDPMTVDFLENTKGHPVIMNFSTIPQWMFKTDKKISYPDDPNQVGWGYAGGTQLRDTTLKELTDYYVRLISWYTKGGFTDELGKFHESGYYYDFPYWEILNEPDLEHNMTPQMYTKIYDALAIAIRGVLPKVKFVGIAMAYVKPEWFEFFLNPANHKPGVPIDMISYHCYANANQNQKFDAYEYAVFDKAENFITAVSYIENIRKRLAPKTKTDINELGTFVSEEMRNQPIPPAYWNLSASVFAYFFIELSKAGIDVIGESQLVGFPTQFPDVSMINYLNNKPNARYWVLKLIKDNIKPGDKLVKTDLGANSGGDISAQAFLASGKKVVLVLNKRNKAVTFKMPAEFVSGVVSTIDSISGDNEAITSILEGDQLKLQPFAVKLISLK